MTDTPSRWDPPLHPDGAGRTHDALQYIGDESSTVKMQFLSSQSFPAAPDVTSGSYQNVQYGRASLFLATPLSHPAAATRGRPIPGSRLHERKNYS